MNNTISKVTVEGKLEYWIKFWDDDPADGYRINSGSIDNELRLDKFEGKRVRITIEVLEDEDENLA